jgi:hypothetical protein
MPQQNLRKGEVTSAAHFHVSRHARAHHPGPPVLARGPSVAREQHQRRLIPSPAAPDLAHHFFFFLL